jgi:predicted tellurium resistance membrane protein TerC
VLVFVGAKMLLAEVVKVPPLVSLAVILATLGTAAVASWRKGRSRGAGPRSDELPEQRERASVSGF